MRQARIFTPDNLLLIRQMAAEGRSSIEIAESIASTPASVRVVCCHHNIKLTRGRTPSNHAIVTRLPASLFTEFSAQGGGLAYPGLRPRQKIASGYRSQQYL